METRAKVIWKLESVAKPSVMAARFVGQCRHHLKPRTRQYANYMPLACRRREYKMSDSDEDIALIGLYVISQRKRSRKRRIWIHDVIGRRRQYGEYH